jgi:hypothetical protein
VSEPKKIIVQMKCNKCGSILWRGNNFQEFLNQSMRCETCEAREEIVKQHTLYLICFILYTFWILFKCYQNIF